MFLMHLETVVYFAHVFTPHPSPTGDIDVIGRQVHQTENSFRTLRQPWSVVQYIGWDFWVACMYHHPWGRHVLRTAVDRANNSCLDLSGAARCTLTTAAKEAVPGR
jgi:hypothetical protein